MTDKSIYPTKNSGNADIEPSPSTNNMEGDFNNPFIST